MRVFYGAPDYSESVAEIAFLESLRHVNTQLCAPHVQTSNATLPQSSTFRDGMIFWVTKSLQ